MGNRDVPYKPDAVCDGCGAKGAWDFMGDFICQKCSEGVVTVSEPIRIEMPRLNKAKMRTLEKVFAAEIEGRMYQSNAKVCHQLAAEGYLQKSTQVFRTGLGSLTCHGWDLTHAGRITYCESCEDAEEP